MCCLWPVCRLWPAHEDGRAARKPMKTMHVLRHTTLVPPARLGLGVPPNGWGCHNTLLIIGSCCNSTGSVDRQASANGRIKTSMPHLAWWNWHARRLMQHHPAPLTGLEGTGVWMAWIRNTSNWVEGVPVGRARLPPSASCCCGGAEELSIDHPGHAASPVASATEGQQACRPQLGSVAPP